jgi:hypothetical protein
MKGTSMLGYHILAGRSVPNNPFNL